MSKNKIVLVGNYGNDNNGDEAILLGAIKLLQKNEVDNEDIIVISNNPNSTKRLTGLSSYPLISKKSNSTIVNVISTIIGHYKVLRKTDKIVFAGGGTMMDMYKRDLIIYSAISSIGKITRNKVYIFGVGAGPINTSLGKRLMRLILKQSELISVRDYGSLKQLQHLTEKKVEVVNDLAFFIESNQKANNKNDVSVASNDPNDRLVIGVTTLPYFSNVYWPEADSRKYSIYLNGLAKSINYFLDKIPYAEVKIFATKYPEDTYSNADLYKLIDKRNSYRVELIEDNLKPQNLLNKMENMDLIIGTRLHSLILASVLNKPIIALGYHRKVQGFMEKYNLESNLVDINVDYEKKLNECLLRYMESSEEFILSKNIDSEKKITLKFGERILNG